MPPDLGRSAHLYVSDSCAKEPIDITVFSATAPQTASTFRNTNISNFLDNFIAHSDGERV